MCILYMIIISIFFINNIIYIINKIITDYGGPLKNCNLKNCNLASFDFSIICSTVK